MIFFSYRVRLRSILNEEFLAVHAIMSRIIAEGDGVGPGLKPDFLASAR